jgi:MoxR-vWA-beta-propeller ternary system domain bpX2
MTKPQPLLACRAARVPADGLESLAPLRTKGGIRVVAGEVAWVTWENDRPDVIIALLAVPGAELFEPHDGRWFRPGDRLPAFDVPPAGESIALDRIVVPAALTTSDPDAREQRRVPLKLVRSEVVKPTSAIRCQVESLRAWADTATTADITAVKATRSGDVVWLLGNKLPAIPGAERFWGERVLIPLGYRAEPDWPESALREATGIGPDEVLVLTEGGSEALPADAFRPLTRAAIRHAFQANGPA